MDAATGDAHPVDWRGELAARGLQMTEMYLVDARGTLLFVTHPVSAMPSKRADEDVWLWIRTPAGDYVQVAPTSHYERTAGDEVIYWVPETRHFTAFDVVTHATRDLPDYRVPPYEDVTEGVLVEGGGKSVMFGRKGAAGWAYEPLPLEMSRLK